MAKHKIFCILGRSASGKSTIAKEVAKQLGLTVVKSYTTSLPPPGKLPIIQIIFLSHQIRSINTSPK